MSWLERKPGNEFFQAARARAVGLAICAPREIACLFARKLSAHLEANAFTPHFVATQAFFDGVESDDRDYWLMGGAQNPNPEYLRQLARIVLLIFNRVFECVFGSLQFAKGV